jgi:hypothetical protein
VDEIKKVSSGLSRRNFVASSGVLAAGGLALGAGLAPRATAEALSGGTSIKGRTVPLNWKEVYFTNCPMVSANNIDQELGWCKTDFKAIGIDYSYFRSRRENDWYPH